MTQLPHLENPSTSNVSSDSLEIRFATRINLYVNNKEVDQSFLRDSNPDLIKSSYEMNEETAMPVNNYWSLEDLEQVRVLEFMEPWCVCCARRTVFVMETTVLQAKTLATSDTFVQDTIKGVVKQMPFTSDRTSICN